MNKYIFRERAKQIQSELTDEYRRSASSVIEEKIISSESFSLAKSVFVYVSSATEPSTSGIICAALSLKKTVLVPRCTAEGEMELVKITSTDDLTLGRYGLLEPNLELRSTFDDADLAIIPCVAATADGKRLGHGGGYYDRFLEKSSAERVCLCFSRLIFDDLPTEEHDCTMDEVVSENYFPSRRGVGWSPLPSRSSASALQRCPPDTRAPARANSELFSEVEGRMEKGEGFIR